MCNMYVTYMYMCLYGGFKIVNLYIQGIDAFFANKSLCVRKEIFYGFHNPFLSFFRCLSREVSRSFVFNLEFLFSCFD